MLTLDDLGQCDKVVSTKDDARIVDGTGFEALVIDISAKKPVATLPMPKY